MGRSMFCFTTAAAILEIRSRLWLWRVPPTRDAPSRTTPGLTSRLKRAAFSLAITRDWPLMVDGSTEFGWRSLLLRRTRGTGGARVEEARRNKRSEGDEAAT